MAALSLKKAARKQLIFGLMLTIALGITFLYLQANDYLLAYQVYGLKFTSGIYGSLFFMMTGAHALHVAIGVIMLFIILLRCLKGHFTANDHFGFEATAWFWQFIAMVWFGVFVFAYWL